MNVALVGHGGGLRLAVCGDRLEGGYLRLGVCGGNYSGGDGGSCELGCFKSCGGNYSRRELSSRGGDERVFSTAAGNRTHNIHRSHWMRERCDHATQRWHRNCCLGERCRDGHGDGSLHRQR